MATTQFAQSVYADQVRSRRRDLKLSQQELSDLSGVSVRFIHDVERGKPTVQFDRFLQMCDALGLDVVLQRRNSMAPTDRVSP